MKKFILVTAAVAALGAAGAVNADDQGTGYNRYGFTPAHAQSAPAYATNAQDQSTAYNRYGVATPRRAAEALAPTQEEIEAYTGGQVRYAQAQAKPVDPAQAAREQAQIQSLLDAFGITYEQAHALGIL